MCGKQPVWCRRQVGKWGPPLPQVSARWGGGVCPPSHRLVGYPPSFESESRRLALLM